MSIVQEYIKCPQCGGIYNHTVNICTGEQHDVCGCCGKKYRKELRLDQDGKVLCDENGDPQYMILDRFGYGVMGVQHLDGTSAVYQLSEPGGNIRGIFEQLLQQDCVDAKQSYLTSWNAKEKRIEAVYGPFPKLFEEFICDNTNDG